MSCGIRFWVVTSLALALLGRSSALAQQARVVAEEVREFEVLVKGQSSGKNLIKITETDDGMTLVTTEVAVALDYIVYTYRYEFHGKEAWQGDHLVWVDDHAVDAGKKLSTRARVDARGSTIEANDKTNRAAAILDMTTNYWRAPHIGSKSGVYSLLNADQGTIQTAKMEYVGLESVNVLGKQQDCTHLRFRGGVTVDMWVDGRGRIVWQKAIEDGYPTELKLKRLTNNMATARAWSPSPR